MAAIDCVKIFSEAPEDKTRADYIDTHAPDRSCQLQVVSEHCDECVRDDETIVRIVVDDTHIVREDGNARLRSSFMSDAMSFGSSSLRLGRASKEEFQITVDEILDRAAPKADGQPKTVIGYVLIPVATTRSQEVTAVEKKNGAETHHTTLAFGVYASGLPKRPNHADAFCVANCGPYTFSKSARNRATMKLTREIETNFHQVANLDEVLALGLDAASTL